MRHCLICWNSTTVFVDFLTTRNLYSNTQITYCAWSTWIAVVVAYRGLEIEFIARERIVFCLAYVGVGSLALLASFLTYRMMMLNRFIADEIAFKYAGRGRNGLLIAFALSHLLLIPFIAMSVLIGASVWHLLK